MRIQIASDLHLEFLQRSFPREQLIAPAYGADALVLAGDIANGTQAIGLFADWPVPVLYLAGNHEFYGHDMNELRAQLREKAQGTSVRFLDNDVVDFDGVRVLGATLWTDYRLLPGHTQHELMHRAEQSLSDHRVIKTGGARFTAQHALIEHERSCAWLTRQLNEPYNGQTVVISHHGPHLLSVHPRYIGDTLNAAFVSDLSALVVKADLWVHGHVHDSFDYRAGKCRVVANPLGYVRETRSSAKARELQYENPAFDWTCVVDVPSSRLNQPNASDARLKTSGSDT